MASPRRETVLAYSGGLLDRAASQLNDPGWIDATLARADTRLIPLWRDQFAADLSPAGESQAVCESPEDGTVSNDALSNDATRLWITPKVIHRRQNRASPFPAARRTLAK